MRYREGFWKNPKSSCESRSHVHVRGCIKNEVRPEKALGLHIGLTLRHQQQTEDEVKASAAWLSTEGLP